MFKTLAEAIKQLAVASAGLTHELGLWREQRNRDLATKDDVTKAKREILDALELSEQDRAKLDALQRRAERTAKNVERLAKGLTKLDAQTPKRK